MTSANTPQDERETRIMQAASNLISHYGYDKTTVSDIAKQAGISKGAIYLHFKSKETLFEALIAHETRIATDEIVRRIEDDDDDPDGDILFTFYSISLSVINRNPILRALITQDKRLLGDFARQISQAGYYERLQPFGETLVQRFQKAGLIRDDLSVKTILYLLGIIRIGFFMSHDILPDETIPSYDELNTILPDVLSRALSTQEAISPEIREKGKAIITEILTTHKQNFKIHGADDI